MAQLANTKSGFTARSQPASGHRHGGEALVKQESSASGLSVAKNAVATESQGLEVKKSYSKRT
jgi:hypothetical protein